MLVPTDPEFDANLLPRGLRLCVTMGKTYPGAEAVLKESSGFKDGFIDAEEDAAVATSAALAAAVSEGSMSKPKPQHAAKDDVDFGPTDQQVAAADRTTLTPRSTDEGGGIISSVSSSARLEDVDPPVKRLSREPSSSVAVLKVCNEEINDLRRDAIELVFSKVVEQQLTKHEKTDIVRTAIKALDRHLRGIFDLELTPQVAFSQREEMPWTEDEQRRYEHRIALQFQQRLT